VRFVRMGRGEKFLCSIIPQRSLLPEGNGGGVKTGSGGERRMKMDRGRGKV
jgi:hypothetical protein